MAYKTRTMVLQQSDEGDNRLELPVNPRNVVISRPQNLLRYQTIDGESIQAARGKGLTQVTLRERVPGFTGAPRRRRRWRCCGNGRRTERRCG